jgi:hypothetical protein
VGWVNLLTDALTQESFGYDVRASARRSAIPLGQGEETLLVVPYRAFSGILGLPENVDVLEKGFVLCEDSEAASARRSRASLEEGPAGGAPGDERSPEYFTLALDAGDGVVFYLPEDHAPDANMQLFAFDGGTFARFRAPTALDTDGEREVRIRVGEVDQIYAVEGGCADGPCTQWREGCGPNGCRCRMYTTPDQLGPAGALLRQRGVAGYGLRCR